MIRNILFDLDDTLFDFHKAEHIAVKKTLLGLGITPEQKILDRYSELNNAQWKLLEKGEITREETLLRRWKFLLEEMGSEQDPAMANAAYEENLACGHYYMEGARELLQELCGKYRLYVVSNGTAHVQKGRIGSSDLEKYVENIFISQTVGYDKPDRRFFDRCTSQIPDYQREETILVGDSLSSDMLGGLNAGITTVWYNPGHVQNAAGVPVNYEIDRLDRLKIILLILDERPGDCMVTYTGLRMNPLRMRAEDVRLEDIAHALSLICRGGGQVQHFFSVAQHSINCAKEAEARGWGRRTALGCLLHDAGEAYISDVIRPVKRHLGNYKEIEELIMERVWERFGLGDLTPEEKGRIRQIDDEILEYELVELLRCSSGKALPEMCVQPALGYRDPGEIEKEFMEMAHKLI